MSYIGNTTQNQNYVPAVDYFNGDGLTVAFTLSRPVASVAAVQAVISNVPQNPGSAFSVSGSTITFTSAPPSGTNNIYVYYTSPNTQVVQPGQGTVGPTQVDGNYALWNKSGSDINYTAGNVCVGTTTALATAANRGNVTVNGSSGSIVAMGVGGATKGYLFQDSSTMYLVNSGGGATNVEVNGAARLSIDSSGRVTMPYQTAFSAKNAPATSATSTVIYSTAVYNQGSAYSTSTGRFTAPVAGNYYFSVYALANSGNCNIRLLRNGGTVFYSESDESGFHQISVSGLIPLVASDYVEVQVYTGSLYQTYDNFSGWLVC